MSTGTGGAGGKLSREEWRKLRDLDAARKAGTAPAEVDEEGRDINPHIPQYMAKAPWYVDLGVPSLQHQRPQRKQTSISEIVNFRGLKAVVFAKVVKLTLKKGGAAIKYKPGACENCGAATHKTRDCFERPRSKGARWTNDNLQADEVVVDYDLSWDEKRDRWSGYDTSNHLELLNRSPSPLNPINPYVIEWEVVEKERSKRKAEQLEKGLAELPEKIANKVARHVTTTTTANTDPDATTELPVEEKPTATIPVAADAEFGDSEGSLSDEEKYADNAGQAGQRFDTKTRVTVRNLRIREDTAKYLMNLDPDSAYYDPKTRSMRENPNPHKPDAIYQGDNFVRYTGDAAKVARLQRFAWEATEKGEHDFVLQSNPTLGEKLFLEHQKKQEEEKQQIKDTILEKYGGKEHLEAPPKELLLAQTEEYVEYSRSGQVIKGREPLRTKSKYEEDVYHLNHSAVWGSYWKDGRWGYDCCKALLRNAYCIPSQLQHQQQQQQQQQEKEKEE